MKCPNCGKEEVQIVSECIQTNRHEEPAILPMLKFVFSGILLISICYLIFTIADWNEKEYINILDFPSFAFALKSCVFSVSALMVLSIVKHLFPLKSQTNTKAICTSCGNTWYIETNLQEFRHRYQALEHSTQYLSPEDKYALRKARMSALRDLFIPIIVIVMITIILFATHGC